MKLSDICRIFEFLRYYVLNIYFEYFNYFASVRSHCRFIIFFEIIASLLTYRKRKSKSAMIFFLWKHHMIHIEIDEPYRKKTFKTSTSTFQSSNKSQAPNQKMRIAVAALILVFLLSTTICKGEENRDQEAEDDLANENLYFWVGIIFVIACITIPCCIICCCCC